MKTDTPLNKEPEYIYISIYTHTYIYIHHKYKHTQTFYLYIYIYIYIYIHTHILFIHTHPVFIYIYISSSSCAACMDFPNFLLPSVFFFFHHTMCERTCDTLPSSAANQNCIITLVVSWCGQGITHAFTCMMKKNIYICIPQIQTHTNILFIYIYIYTHSLYIYIYIYIYIIIIIILLCCLHGFPLLSLAICLSYSLLPADLPGYIVCLHKAVVDKSELIILHLWRVPLEKVAYEFIQVHLAVSYMSCLSNLDSSQDG